MFYTDTQSHDNNYGNYAYTTGNSLYVVRVIVSNNFVL